MSFDLNITVNGSRCKQYSHQGKTFIEAKQGSEYVIEVKNNHWKRVLAVGSVDGLNVLTGKTAHESDSGYIIGAYSAEKIKGFRFSDDEWALFKFGYKFNGNTYAQSKEDGSEKNCGVIGVRFFYEKDPIVVTSWTNTWTTYNTTGGIMPQIYNSGTPYTSNVNYQSNNFGAQDITFGSTNNTFKDCSQKISSKKRSASGGCSAGGELRGFAAAAAAPSVNYCAPVEDSACCDFMSVEKERGADFDMGTEWGRKERSKVTTVSFERGSLAQSFDIYYASRESLIAMGVPIQNTLSVNLPQSFPDKYATPPKNWNG
jgi:hypothetical protein